MKNRVFLIILLALTLQLLLINPLSSILIPRSFFVDTTNGEPHSLIVVGKNAADMDLISGGLIISKIQAEAYYEVPSEGVYRINIWEPEKLITYDELLVENQNAITENLILVGGPVANKIVAALVQSGASKIDWYNSQGDIEYLPNALFGSDVIIVAGADREKTRNAVIRLINP